MRECALGLTSILADQRDLSTLIRTKAKIRLEWCRDYGMLTSFIPVATFGARERQTRQRERID